MTAPHISLSDYDTLGWRVKPHAQGSRLSRADMIIAIAVVSVSVMNLADLLWNAVAALRT